MAWITPVTDRGSTKTQTTHTDMNRIAGNVNIACNTNLKTNYTVNDIVTIEEWNALVNAVKEYDSNITYSTHYINLNRIEAATQKAKDNPKPRVYPANNLYPSESLFPLD